MLRHPFAPRDGSALSHHIASPVEAQDIQALLLALVTMAVVLLLVDQLFWRPLVAWGTTASWSTVQRRYSDLYSRWGRAGRGVQAKCRGAGRSVLHCAATDAGPGIPAEFHARVFEPCFWMARHR
jgi:hypothetical protein